MPYPSRRNYRRRSSYRPRRYRPAQSRSKVGAAMSTAAKALALAYSVKQLVNVEKKFIPSSISATPTSSGSITLLNGTSQSDSDQTRDGSSIRVKMCQIKGHVIKNASASSTTVRLLLVIKKDNNSAAPGVTDILDPTQAAVFAQYNRDTIFNFKVLKDFTMVLDDVSTTIKKWNMFKLLNFKVRYDGSGATTADISRNGLYLILVSNQATNTPTFSGEARVTFIDN